MPTCEPRFFGAGLLVLALARSRHLDSGAYPRGVFGSTTFDLSWPIAMAPGASTCLQSTVVGFPVRSGASARADRSTGDLPAAVYVVGPTSMATWLARHDRNGQATLEPRRRYFMLSDV